MLKLTRKGFTLIELMIVVAIIGILTAIAIPNFLKFQAKSKQAEVKANLKGVFLAEKAWFAGNDSYSNLISPMGFNPERGNRYTYDCGGGGSPAWQDRSVQSPAVDSSTAPSFTGITADTYKYTNSGITSVMGMAFTAAITTGNNGSFVATAGGNIDNDATIDQWSISSNVRAGGSASSATACITGNSPGGEPCNDQNDLNQ